MHKIENTAKSMFLRERSWGPGFPKLNGIQQNQGFFILNEINVFPAYPSKATQIPAKLNKLS